MPASRRMVTYRNEFPGVQRILGEHEDIPDFARRGKPSPRCHDWQDNANFRLGGRFIVYINCRCEEVYVFRSLGIILQPYLQNAFIFIQEFVFPILPGIGGNGINLRIDSRRI